MKLLIITYYVLLYIALSMMAYLFVIKRNNKDYWIDLHINKIKKIFKNNKSLNSN